MTCRPGHDRVRLNSQGIVTSGRTLSSAIAGKNHRGSFTAHLLLADGFVTSLDLRGI